jgi:hypothetical protein
MYLHYTSAVTSMRDSLEKPANRCHTNVMPPLVITTPFAGARRAAKLLGVSATRTRELIAMAETGSDSAFHTPVQHAL